MTMVRLSSGRVFGMLPASDGGVELVDFSGESIDPSEEQSDRVCVQNLPFELLRRCRFDRVVVTVAELEDAVHSLEVLIEFVGKRHWPIIHKRDKREPDHVYPVGVEARRVGSSNPFSSQAAR